MNQKPTQDIFAAFNLSGDPKLLPGGQGTTWIVGNGVIKPSGNSPTVLYIADIMEKIVEDGFRVARPIKSSEGAWIYKGWTAYHRIDGEHVKRRWDEKIVVCKAFHKVLEKYPKPDFLGKGTDRYTIADQIAWQEIPLEASFKSLPLLEKLQQLILPIKGKDQLIHGDFGGNILFADGLAPAVIDFSPYWRPAEYAIAIMIADALVWEGAGTSLLEENSDIPDLHQLVIRALIGRIMQFDGWMQEEKIDKSRAIQAHSPVIEMFAKLMK